MNITKHKCAFAALAAFALAALMPIEAEYYWLLSGDLKPNAGQRSDLNGNGLGCWLELTNDTAGVDYKPVKIYDIRRKAAGGTDLVKYSENAGQIPFDGCRYGEAEVDFSLPIRGADGTSYRLTAINNYAFQENYYVGKVVLTNSLEYIGQRAFRNCYYLRTVTFPDPATWTPQYIGKESDGMFHVYSTGGKKIGAFQASSKLYIKNGYIVVVLPTNSVQVYDASGKQDSQSEVSKEVNRISSRKRVETLDADTSYYNVNL